jgi:hypothetical protein
MDALASAGVRPPVDQFRPGFRALLDALTPEYFRQPEFQPPEPGTVGKVPQASRGYGDMLAGGAIEAASMMTPAGAGKAMALPLMGMAARYGKWPIRAFHGSPHDFNKFSLDKIGTGEGAQAYGHGLYFAESEGVAKSYRDQLSGRITTLPVAIDGGRFTPPTDAHQRAAAIIAKDGRASAQQVLRTGLREGTMDDADARAYREVLAATRGREVSALPAGRMYEVGIHADPQRFLDWDRPINGQSKAVKDALVSTLEDRASASPEAENMLRQMLRGSEYRGSEAYRALAGPWGKSLSSATDALSGANIPGIKYLDQGSRAAGDGSRNYVVFDDSIIEILRKYGIAGLAMLPPAVAATMLTQNEAQAQPSDGREQLESALMQRTTR